MKLSYTHTHTLLNWTTLYTDRRSFTDNMSAALCAFILTCSALCGSTVVSGVLSKPTNVRLTSHDMNLVLRWESKEQPAGLVYTAEYKPSLADYRVGCVNISTLECDFTCLNISIFQYGKYTGRVRAQSGSETSVWVESNQTTLDKDTIISSPNVSLFSNGATIEVSIQDPIFAISALREVYNSATYNITYWQDGQKQKAKSISNIQQSWVVLNDLEPWTKYCVQVQIKTGRNADTNLSKPSSAVCESTTVEEEAPWVPAVVTFVVMAMAVALVVVAVLYRKRIFHFLCPKDALPQHFKEDLLACPNSSMYIAMGNPHPAEEIYHQVIIMADSRTLAEGRPLESAGQPDTT
ncbi:interleukin-10 receptor subunit beta-like [Cottoperca gobio]|uniref:Interleukin-10 receptor subunit beta-like n=1 Tax=Cottoperca gobio TaxID=56716 RepID=A0A6J2RVP1_COTGO|nr:interleukin-10 receptor subunit beta-like [Cottoperca gobio]